MKKKRKGGEKLNLKIALLLSIIFFASVITVVQTALTLPTPNTFGSADTPYISGFEIYPLGDEVDDPVAPK